MIQSSILLKKKPGSSPGLNAPLRFCYASRLLKKLNIQRKCVCSRNDQLQVRQAKMINEDFK
jgi:hypothetical protein